MQVARKARRVGGNGRHSTDASQGVEPGLSENRGQQPGYSEEVNVNSKSQTRNSNSFSRTEGRDFFRFPNKGDLKISQADQEANPFVTNPL